MTATQQASKSDYHILLQVREDSGLPENPPHCELVSMVIEIIEKERAKVLELRTKEGLHRLETEKTRFERWEITVAKLMALDAVLRSILDHEEHLKAENLTGRKSIFSTIEESATLHEVHAAFYGSMKQVESSALHRHKAKALRELQEKLSGSAGTQPLTSEEAAQPMGTKPVTVAPLNPLDVKSLPTSTLLEMSERILDALEERDSLRWLA